MDYEVIAQWAEIIGGFAFIIVAVWLFRKYVLPAITANQIARNAELTNAEKFRDDLKAQVDEARATREAATREAAAIVAQGDADAQREYQRVIDEGHRDASRLLANAQGELERARNVARDRLRIEFIEKALLRARELAASKMTDAVNTRIVERVVDDVSTGKGR